jgi:hypothetical protein
MRFVGSLLLVITAFAICTVGCGGTDQGKQVASDQELSDYGQASAPAEWKDALDAVKKDSSSD